MSNIGEYVRICCVKRNMSLAELARKSKLTAQNLSNKISRNKFTNEDLEAIATALGAKVNLYFTDAETNEVF